MEQGQVQKPTRAEKAITTTKNKALTLFQDGYEIHPDLDRAGVYLVQTPERKRGNMVYRHVYEVDLANKTCDCEQFQFHGVCKHLEACEKIVAKAVELAGPLLLGTRKPEPKEEAKGAGYAALYEAPSGGNLRAQSRIETQANGTQVDTVTGEVLEEVENPKGVSVSPVYVLPVHGSSEWLRQVDKDFLD